MNRYFNIDPRPNDLGGGWILTLFENGEEAGGSIFTKKIEVVDGETMDVAYEAASYEGFRWVDIDE